MVKVPCNSVAKWLSHQTENLRDPEFKSISDYQIDLLQQGRPGSSPGLLFYMICLLPIRILNLSRLFDLLL